MYQDRDRLCPGVGLRHVQVAIEFASQSAPGVLCDVIAAAILIGRHTNHMHQMVVSGGIRIEELLSQGLSYVKLFLGRVSQSVSLLGFNGVVYSILRRPLSLKGRWEPAS